MLGKLSSFFNASNREDGADGAGGRVTAKIFGFLVKSLERAVGFALLIVFLFVYVKDPEPLQQLRFAVFDFFQNVKPREIPPPGESPVTIIDIDEKSLAEVGQMPWPRSIMAKLVDNLTQMGAAVVAFAIFFPEPDRMNPEGVVASLAGIDDETRAKLLALPSNDQLLANALKKSRVILGQAGYWGDRELKAGVHVNYLDFDRNLSRYSFGHGGYFSPQDHISVAFPVSFSEQRGRWSYSARVSPGFQSYSEAAEDFFPTDGESQALLDDRGVLGQYLHDPGSDGPETDQPHTDAPPALGRHDRSTPLSPV